MLLLCLLGSLHGSFDDIRRRAQRRRQWRNRHNHQCVTPRDFVRLAHNAFFFIWSAMYSLVRIESARMVHVGFLSACDTKGAPSATKRFFTSCACDHLLRTDVFGSSPMRAPPSS